MNRQRGTSSHFPRKTDSNFPLPVSAVTLSFPFFPWLNTKLLGVTTRLVAGRVAVKSRRKEQQFQQWVVKGGKRTGLLSRDETYEIKRSNGC